VPAGRLKPGVERSGSKELAWVAITLPGGIRDSFRLTLLSAGESQPISTKGDQVMPPVHRGKDGKGPYYRWGDSGKKYRYEAGEKKSRVAAKQKAEKQGRAARASGYKG
jgi:hypothetical protein